MRTLDFKELAKRSRALDIWGRIDKTSDTKPRDSESRRALVLADAASIKKSVDFSKFVRVSDGMPLGGGKVGKSERIT